MAERSLQAQISHNHCYGCGPLNERGLTLESYGSGVGPSRACFVPEPHHCAGPKHFVNGGILTTLIDCHCICTATAAAYLSERRAIGTEPYLCFATSKLAVELLRRQLRVDDAAPSETRISMIYLKWTSSELVTLEHDALYTEIDEDGWVQRELGVAADGEVTHQITTSAAEPGWFGLSRLSQAMLASNVSRSEFEALWQRSGRIERRAPKRDGSG